MSNAKEGIFSAFKKSLVKTSCCGPVCVVPAKQESAKKTVISNAVKNKK